MVGGLPGSEVAGFLDEHVQQMRSITPVESKHALDLDPQVLLTAPATHH